MSVTQVQCNHFVEWKEMVKNKSHSNHLEPELTIESFFRAFSHFQPTGRWLFFIQEVPDLFIVNFYHAECNLWERELYDTQLGKPLLQNGRKVKDCD